MRVGSTAVIPGAAGPARRTLLASGLLALALAAATPAISAGAAGALVGPNDLVPDPAQLAAELMESRVGAQVPGCSTAVGVDGKIVWRQAWGFADVESGRPMTPQTRSRIGSTSKAVTAGLAGRLVDRGRLDLDRPVVELTDLLAGRTQESGWSELTTAHLLSNQGGIRHYKGMEFASRKHYASLRDALGIFLEDPLRFAPGRDFSYSSYGFNLAGVVLEEVGEGNFGELLQREVFGPLAMASSGLDDVTADIPERATFYREGKDAARVAMAVDDSYKWPSGGLLSTPSDMVRFGSAFLAPGFLEASTLRRITTARSTSTGEQTGYALGWRVLDDPQHLAYRALHHGGSSMGARSMLVVVPETGVVVSTLCNADAYETKEKDAFAVAALFADGSR